MYKRGASASGMIGNAKMVGNNGLGLPTFGDSFLKFLKTLGLWITKRIFVGWILLWCLNKVVFGDIWFIQGVWSKVDGDEGWKWTLYSKRSIQKGRLGRSCAKPDGHSSKGEPSCTILKVFWVKFDGHSTKNGPNALNDKSRRSRSSKVDDALFDFRIVHLYRPSTFSHSKRPVYYLTAQFQSIGTSN